MPLVAAEGVHVAFFLWQTVNPFFFLFFLFRFRVGIDVDIKTLDSIYTQDK